jgi:hypothetical protein
MVFQMFFIGSLKVFFKKSVRVKHPVSKHLSAQGRLDPRGGL